MLALHPTETHSLWTMEADSILLPRVEEEIVYIFSLLKLCILAELILKRSLNALQFSF